MILDFCEQTLRDINCAQFFSRPFCFHARLYQNTWKLFLLKRHFSHLLRFISSIFLKVICEKQIAYQFSCIQQNKIGNFHQEETQ